MFSRSRPFSFFGKMPRTGDPLANLTNLFKRKIVKNLSNYSENCNALTSIPKIVVRGTLLALFAFIVLLPGAEPALASTKPVNIVGKWVMVSIGGSAYATNSGQVLIGKVFSITAENFATGALSAAGSPHYDGTRFGTISGNTITVPDARVGNIQIHMTGTVSDNGTKLSLTAIYTDTNTGEVQNLIVKYSRQTQLVVSAVTPSAGLISGNSSVTLTGSGFKGATAVDFVLQNGSTVAAQSFSVVNDTTISAKTPSITGKISKSTNQMISNVVVSVGSKKSDTVAGDQFEFSKLIVTGLSIKSGLAQGGTKITVTGAGFKNATKVEFAPNTSPPSLDPPVAALSFSVSNDKTIVVTTPKATNVISAGSSKILTDLVVYVKKEHSPKVTEDHYTFEYLQLTKVTPSNGSVNGGTHVALVGQDFKQVTAVLFVYDSKKVGVPAHFAALSDQKIVLTTPKMADHLPGGKFSIPTDIIVMVGQFPTKPHSTDRYTFSKLGVSAVSPNSGKVAGGNTVLLTGAGFTGATKVILSDGNYSLSSTPKVSSDTTLSFVAPSIAKSSGLKKLNFNATVVVGNIKSAASKGSTYTYSKAQG